MIKDNFTASQFVPFIPIKKRTFSSIKQRYGQQVLIDIKNLLLSDITRYAKKRLFYDGFNVLQEGLKDIIWETYVEMELAKYNEANK